MNAQVVNDKKRINLLIFMFAAFYFVSYLTRNNYATIISEIISAEGITKSEASLAVTGLSIFYGAGQLISGFLGDRIQPKYLIFSGLLIASTANVLMPFCPSHYYMTAIWCLNGFAQAFMWPPIVKLCASLFDSTTYSVACLKISYGSAMGTIFLYLFSPLVIRVSSWRVLFFGTAACGIIAAVVALLKCVKIELKPRSSKNSDVKGEKFTGAVIIVTAVIMLAIILQGILRDGVTTWMPSYLSETFKLGNDISILSGVALPVFSMLCYSLSQKLCARFFRNEMVCSALIFGLCAVCALLLGSFGIKTPLLSVFLIALVVGTMHGVNLILVCMVPGMYKKYGNVSFISGMLNSCTYVGSAISTYGFALFSEKLGWQGTIFIWAVIAGLGATLCLVISKKWIKIK